MRSKQRPRGPKLKSARPKSKPKVSSVTARRLLFLSFVCISAGTLLHLIGSGNPIGTWFTSLFSSKPSEPQVDVRSVVVQQVRNASELTTAVYTMEAIVPTQQEAAIGGLVVGTTKLLYIARGEVRAGVDLNMLSASDVTLVGDTLRLRLPSARVLDTKLDVAKSSVYDYNRGFLSLGPDAAPALQKAAQEEAVKKIRETACREGVLEKASDRAKLVVGQLVRISGVSNVVVDAQPINPAACLKP